MSCEVIPKDLTEGACEALAGATSNDILECLWSSLGFKCSKIGISEINLCVNVLKSSALFLLADTTRIFLCGFISS